MKTCPNCKQQKTDDHFYKPKSGEAPSGYCNECRGEIFAEFSTDEIWARLVELELKERGIDINSLDDGLVL